MPDSPNRIQIIDSHTGGEPTRVVVGGFPDLGEGTMKERMERFKNEFDHLRTGIVLEPRGSDVLVGALLQEPVDENNTAGVIFFNNAGYLGMCGHGTIGLIETLRHMEWIYAGKHTIETVVGPVQATLHKDGRVEIENVPSYRYKKSVSVDVPGIGPVAGDIAWGGNWFFLVNDHGQDLTLNNVDTLTDWTWSVRLALEANGITGENGGLIDHIELFAPDDKADSKNFVLCPGKAYDRSPCGTGTSAKLACLAADGKLKEGEVWRQASIIGSVFEGSYRTNGDKVIPTIRGTAHVTAEATLLLDPADPYQWGIR